MQNKVAGSCGNSGSRICPAAQPLTESTKAYRDPLLRSRWSTRSAGPEITTQSGQLTALPETPLSVQHHPGTGHDETVCTAPTRNRGDPDQRTPGRTCGPVSCQDARRILTIFWLPRYPGPAMPASGNREKKASKTSVSLQQRTRRSQRSPRCRVPKKAREIFESLPTTLTPFLIGRLSNNTSDPIPLAVDDNK